MRKKDGQTSFEDVDWNEIDSSESPTSPRRVTFLGGVSVLAVLYWYDTRFANVYLVGEWTVDPIDWAFLLAGIIILSYGVVPFVRRRRTLSRVWTRLRSRPTTRFGIGYLGVLLVVGAVGPLVYPAPGLQYQFGLLPPFGFATEFYVNECLGTVTGGAFDRTCHGSLTFPLGTNHRGHPMGYLLITGARVALYVLVITAGFVVPLATVVGVVAGLWGGLVDDLLMAYVDMQLSLPAILVYIVANAYWNTSLFVLLVTFGLLSWGGIARIVRSEVLQRREAGHVRVARSFGASWPYVARRHILPNVTNTVVPAVFQLLALLVLVEAGIAFLGFHDIELYSWGSTIQEALGAGAPTYAVWWISAFPALALLLTIVSLKLVGDGLRDALDPRESG